VRIRLSFCSSYADRSKVVVKRELTLRLVLRLLMKLLMGVRVLSVIVFFAAVPGARDLPRSLYNSARWWDITISWNGVKFKLPPPWFPLGKEEQAAGTLTFFRDQFPWAERNFSAITFKEPFAGDFSQNPKDGLRRWEQLKDSIWSKPISYPKVIGHYYSTAHGSKNEFRCANTEQQFESGEMHMEIECIETRNGWGFGYEGRQEDVAEALFILENGA